MKNVLIILSIGLCLFSCQPDNTTIPQQPVPTVCTIDYHKLWYAKWIEVTDHSQNIAFQSDSYYYVNGVLLGQWTISNNCDLLTTSKKDTFYLITLTDTTLKLKHTGVIKDYFKE